MMIASVVSPGGPAARRGLAGQCLHEESIELLVIQPTPFCNLDCDYCYLPERSNKQRLSLDVLESVFAKVLESGRVGKDLTILWHAGEPLVLPVSYYEQAAEIFSRLAPASVRIGHCFQTNGVLIDDCWSRFLEQSRARVGISIDGPAFIHDRHRKTRTGQGTHADVMTGIETLQSHGIDFYVITVLTSAALDHPHEMFEFYRHSGIHRVSFNVEEIEGGHRLSSLSGERQEQRYRQFFSEFFKLMIDHPGVVSLRETERAARAILAPFRPDPPNQQARPYGIVSIDCCGGASTFSPELIGQKHPEYENFRFVDLLSQGLCDLEQNAAFQHMAGAVNEGIRRCKKACPYFSLCGGGAPANKFYESGTFDSTETLYCRLGTQIPVDTVLAELERRALSGETVPAWLTGVQAGAT